MDSSENKKNNNKQIYIKNNDIRYIIKKSSSNVYDDYYILHSLKNIVKKINTLKEKNNNIKVLLVSINSGKPTQLKKSINM
ncbi:hypothetical protein WESB_2015 [Brachyspira pilosicoli WesB]|uniref:Uncharacterized protein n=1 Tax=Brachyspira pilosicoli WesB TaxID=1161918 RepID=K0JM08_BRAPL|nr:hypothetical protein [Brachyspira pilosicoli]CCG57480.1 hypothetical protein WESB_2015 [Brachyspira pilosicoli WesB]